MKAGRLLLGIVLICHGLAHASAGMWATDIGGRGLVTLLWELSSVGFIAAGAGVLSVAELRRTWRAFVLVASVSSLLLLGIFDHPLFVVGIAADIVVLAVAIFSWWNVPSIEPAPIMPRMLQRLMLVFILYVAVLIGLRPRYSSWGSTRSEQQMVLIGDPPLGQSHYRIDHATTINAPVDSVWPWLVQIGQDRGGFYTYDWLERASGAEIRNADRIEPAWQQRRQGDVIRAAQPDYLRGLFGRNLGWRITQLEPGRAMVLQSWGAFVLSPIDAQTTRMHIRTRGRGVPTISGIALTPLSLLVFEPAHFIMERGMLLGIKRRAEGRIPR
ncbi:MAG TPA: hypothetical protein VFC35_04905 [Gemmatimonadaceae bacterium]|nr:hypothetical protein [Gemmatimonadaceae bacterium]